MKNIHINFKRLEGSKMIIHIDYYKEGEVASCPWFWWIEEDGANQGHGWSSSKKSAF
jgi:hypothetical protein